MHFVAIGWQWLVRKSVQLGRDGTVVLVVGHVLANYAYGEQLRWDNTHLRTLLIPLLRTVFAVLLL